MTSVILHWPDTLRTLQVKEFGKDVQRKDPQTVALRTLPCQHPNWRKNQLWVCVPAVLTKVLILIFVDVYNEISICFEV